MKIGLIGAPSAGKDTFADFLVKHKSFKKLASADQIKEEFYKKYNITEEYFKSIRGLPEEQIIRNGLWTYSDEMRNKYGKLHFITPVIQKIGTSGNVVITDVRTEDELQQMCQIEAGLILVVRELKLDILNPSIFPGTRIKISKLIGIPTLWNYSDNITTSNREFDIFYSDYFLKSY